MAVKQDALQIAYEAIFETGTLRMLICNGSLWDDASAENSEVLATEVAMANRITLTVASDEFVPDSNELLVTLTGTYNGPALQGDAQAVLRGGRQSSARSVQSVAGAVATVDSSTDWGVGDVVYNQLGESSTISAISGANVTVADASILTSATQLINGQGDLLQAKRSPSFVLLANVDSQLTVQLALAGA